MPVCLATGCGSPVPLLCSGGLLSACPEIVDELWVRQTSELLSFPVAMQIHLLYGDLNPALGVGHILKYDLL